MPCENAEIPFVFITPNRLHLQRGNQGTPYIITGLPFFWDPVFDIAIPDRVSSPIVSGNPRRRGLARCPVLTESLDRFFARRTGQQTPPVSRDLQQGSDLHETVVFALQVGAGAAPPIIARRDDQSRPNRVEFHVTRGRQQVRILHDERSEPTLPQMPPPIFPEIDPPRVTPVRLVGRASKAEESKPLASD
jgi:hypothetical protein